MVLKKILNLSKEESISGKRTVVTCMGIKFKLKGVAYGVKYNFFEQIFSIKDSYDKQSLILSLLGIKIPFKKITSIKDRLDYINWVCNHQLDKSNFVKLNNTNYDFTNNITKTIAFYLPQFHDFEENIKWFGRGFSEWSNTSKAVPQYTGHWQPHVPIDVGYYNLDTVEPMRRQIDLAKKYGIYGFSFYYYWFSGEKLMEKPLERFLADKSLNMPFFLFWANEDWTRLWGDGGEKEVLHKQEIKDGDAERFMQDALPYFQDERYIKINNRPLLIIYDPQKYPYEKYINFDKRIREIAKENGYDDLYILTTTARATDFNIKYEDFIKKYNLEGLFEFYPQGLSWHGLMDYKYEKIVNSKFKHKIFDVSKYIKEKRYLYDTSVNLFKGCFPNWDNTPRKCYKEAFVFQNTPKNYKNWLKNIIEWTQKNKAPEEQFVFINAWNEWAEGAHLEPDQKYGYAYLQATRDALEESNL